MNAPRLKVKYRQWSRGGDTPKHQQERGVRYGNRRKEVARLKVKDRRRDRKRQTADFTLET